MTQDEIIEMARQAGIYHAQDSEYHWDGLTDQKIIERTPDSAKDIAWRNRRTFEILQPFAKLVAEAEREACAKVCEELVAHTDPNKERDGYFAAVACTLAIRARGKA